MIAETKEYGGRFSGLVLLHIIRALTSRPLVRFRLVLRRCISQLLCTVLDIVYFSIMPARSNMKRRLNEDVLRLIALGCSTRDLRCMRAASHLFCILFTPFAFHSIDIWCSHSWSEAIMSCMDQLMTHHAHLIAYIRRFTIRFGPCSYNYGMVTREASVQFSF
jgi:hypothetical protein